MSSNTAPPDLNELRQRILNGETYTHEELLAALTVLRANRTETATKSVAKRTAAAPMSDDALNASLAQLGLDL